jgi:hypothetical protein
MPNDQWPTKDQRPNPKSKVRRLISVLVIGPLEFCWPLVIGHCLSFPARNAPWRDSFLRRARRTVPVTLCRSMGSAILACRAARAPRVAGTRVRRTGDNGRTQTFRFIFPPLLSRTARLCAPLSFPTLLSTVTCSPVLRSAGILRSSHLSYRPLLPCLLTSCFRLTTSPHPVHCLLSTLACLAQRGF